MFDGGQADFGRGRKSLLSFGRETEDMASAGYAAASHDTPREAVRETAQDRHRSARSRRETQPNRMLEALASNQAEARSSGERNHVPGHQAELPGADGVESGTRPQVDALGAAPSKAGAGVLRSEEEKTGVRGYLRSWIPGTGAPDPLAPPTAGVAVAEASAPSPEAVYPDPRPGTVSRRYADRQDYLDPSDGPLWTPLIDPLKVITTIFDSKRLILATTILGALIGVGIALSTPKKYEAITSLIADPRDLKLSERDLTEQGLPSDATLAIVENRVAVLTSGSVLSKVVEDLNLTEDPEFNGGQKSFSIGAFIGELRGLLTRSEGTRNDVDRKTLAIENLARSLSVERGGKTFVINIGARTESAEKSELIANTVADVFLKTFGQIQSNTAGRAADELTGRLDELRKGVEAAERAVAAFKAENDIIDPQGRLITDDEIIKLNEQLSVARARTLELNARAASVRDIDVDTVLGGANPESMASGIVTELRSQYAAAKQETDRLAVRLGPRHPERQAAEAQLAGVREQIVVELRRITSSIQVELKRAVELEQQLARRLAQLKVRQGDVSTELVQLRELEREVTTKRAVYESYLLRAKETGEQRDLNTSNMTIISRAYAPLDPSGPSRAIIAFTGMMLGFASGVGLAAMRGAYEALRDRRREVGMTRRSTSAHRKPDDDGPPPPPAPITGGATGGDQTPGKTAPPDHSRSIAPDASPTRASLQHDPATPEVAKEDIPMQSRYPDPYRNIGQAYPSHPADHWMPAPQPVYPPQGYMAHQPYASPYPAHYPPAGMPHAQPAPNVAPAYYPAPPAAYPQATAGHYPFAQPEPPRYAPPMHPVSAPYGYPAPQPMPPMQHGHFPHYPVPDAGYPHAAPPHSAFAGADHPNVVAYPGHSVQAADATPPGSASLAEERAASSRAIDEIRASLAEFREAVRDLTENRQKRRFF